MAGEYSRGAFNTRFSRRVPADSVGIQARVGRRVSGLRRMLIDQSGERKAMLKMGEQKVSRLIAWCWCTGPEEEIKIVRWIFQTFIGEAKIESEIAVILNAQGVKTDFGREWNRATVHQILSNEKYIGNNVYHRTSCKLEEEALSTTRRTSGFSANGAFEGVVEPELFCQAREIILARSQKLTDEENAGKAPYPTENARSHFGHPD